MKWAATGFSVLLFLTTAVLVIEKMRSWDPNFRKMRKSYWIHHLKSLAP